MPNQTPNYNLTKPLTTENYDVNVFNRNADIIDGTLKDHNDNITNLGTTKFDKVRVVNNLSTTEDGFALDAKAGKTLQDNIEGTVKFPYRYSQNTDGNTILKAGWSICNTNVNSPAEGEFYVLVLNLYDTVLRQVWFGIWDNSSIFTRQRSAAGVWSQFKEL